MSEDTEPAPTGVHFDIDAMCEAAWGEWDRSFNTSGNLTSWPHLAPRWRTEWKTAMLAGIAAGWSAATRAPDAGRVADVDRVLGILDTELPERGGDGG